MFPKKNVLIFFFLIRKHAIITGGSSGLGKALASRLLREGCNVTIIARNLGNLEKAREELLVRQKFFF